MKSEEWLEKCQNETFDSEDSNLVKEFLLFRIFANIAQIDRFHENMKCQLLLRLNQIHTLSVGIYTTLLLIFLIFDVGFCQAQMRVAINTEFYNDTLITFNGEESYRRYQNDRTFSEDDSDKVPLYVEITNRQLEYFRVNSEKYLMVEYYGVGDFIYPPKIRRKGPVKVNRIKMDSSMLAKLPGRSWDKKMPPAPFIKTLEKEGEWIECEDSVGRSFQIVWIGNYTSNRKTGIWKQTYKYDDTLLLSEIDYDKPGYPEMFTKNLAFTLPIDSLRTKICGFWNLENRGFVTGRVSLNRNGQDISFTKSGILVESHRDYETEKIIRTKRTWKLINRKNKPWILVKDSKGESNWFRIRYFDANGNLLLDEE